MADLFEKRIRRAEQLEKEWPFATELLRFYILIFRFQQDLDRQLEATRSIDIAPWTSRLFELVARHGPPDLARRARTITDPVGLVENYNSGQKLEDPLLEFFPRVLMETAFARTPPPDGRRGEAASGDCPKCDALPLVSLLREDKAAETVRRSLVCSACHYEWDFVRVLCPNCKEEKPEKLPRYTAQEIPWMRVEGCDSCGKYLKSVDLTQNWDAEPVVDELASTPLDVIAREHGYTKIAPNLAGI